MIHEVLYPTKKLLLVTRLTLSAVLLAWVLPVRAQDTSGGGSGTPEAQAVPSQSAPQKDPVAQTPIKKNDANAEVTVQDSGTTFKLNVNLVQVHVVVRDGTGKPVENLKQEDFLLYDQGKLQPISTFTMETRQSRREKAEAAAKTQTQTSALEKIKPDNTVLPDRFIALMFDDVHISLDDATYVKKSVAKFLDGVAPTDRVGIFSSSGQLTHEFTNDKEALKRTVIGLSPRPKYIQPFRECPDISYYEADQIVNTMNKQVFDVVVEETVQCKYGGDRNKIAPARILVQMTAPRLLSQGDAENEFAYRNIEDVLRHLAGMPGERVLLLVSPGFLLTTQTDQMLAVVDRANHANIVVNTLDVRGLYVPDVSGDITRANSDTVLTVGAKTSYRLTSQMQQAYVLSDLAYGTGGAFFHNSNDLAGGLNMIGAAPEVSYVLGFSPQVHKMDGTFHTISVKLTGKRKDTIQARRGYFAPKKLGNQSEQARAEIQEAVFSRDEIQDLPMELQTQYIKTDQSGVHLSVVSKLQMQGVHFRRAGGKNLDNLVVATAIFDENGNFVIGGQKTLVMNLEDATYEKIMQGGLTVKLSFDLKPGKYLVRQVVRDTEGSHMAARNGAVDIPN